MHILLAILGLATAAYFLVMRARRGAEMASELMDVADDIRAAARRFGFQRRYDQHPVDNIEDPRVAVSGLANAFLNLDDLPTADARAVMNVQLRKHLDLDATAAQEIEILGQWLVTECGSAQQAIPRMSKRLNRLDQSGQNFDALMAVIQAVAKAQAGGISPRQTEALQDIQKAFRLK